MQGYLEMERTEKHWHLMLQVGQCFSSIIDILGQAKGLYEPRLDTADMPMTTQGEELSQDPTSSLKEQNLFCPT